jgi:hypothetical protein
MPSSWQVRVAALLVGLGAVLGAGMLLLAGRLLDSDPGFLFAVLPIVAAVVGGAGLFLAAASCTLAVNLWTGGKGARLQTAVLGVVLAVLGLGTLSVQPLAGLLIVVQGLALVALMSTAAAKHDLDGWLEGFKQPAPWGSTPGTGIWSDAPAKHGPWSPDPTTVPWLARRKDAGPQPPWWQTWQVALSRGVPLWEALLLGLALLGWATGMVLIFIDLGHTRIAGGPLLLIALSIGLAWFLERRMRARLAGRV